jgi:hypothetical protein
MPRARVRRHRRGGRSVRGHRRGYKASRGTRAARRAAYTEREFERDRIRALVRERERASARATQAEELERLKHESFSPKFRIRRKEKARNRLDRKLIKAGYYPDGSPIRGAE